MLGNGAGRENVTWRTCRWWWQVERVMRPWAPWRQSTFSWIVKFLREPCPSARDVAPWLVEILSSPSRFAEESTFSFFRPRW